MGLFINSPSPQPSLASKITSPKIGLLQPTAPFLSSLLSSPRPMAPPSSLAFSVRRSEPELVAPAKPTPHEFKPLSDIDDQEGLRFLIPVLQFYKNVPSMHGRVDPAKVIKAALAKALVFYYPFAGRLREGPGRKLVVECTGEGVVFVQADADVSLEQFGDALQPPFPCLEELIFDAQGSAGVFNSPLLLVQVTFVPTGFLT